MKKMVVFLVLVGLIMALAVPSVFAASTNDQQKELGQIQQQMIDLEKKMIQKQLDAGIITQVQAELMLQDLELRSQNQSQFNNNWGAGNYGWGWGCSNYGWGSGMMRGYGGRGCW